MKSNLVVGVVAPCSAVGQVELGFGVEFLRESGFEVRLHPQCAAQHFTFAGTDQQRAEALFEYASNPEIDVIWSARGGYGAGRLLPILAEMTAQRGVPARKLLVGYSDVTMLHEFVRKHWNWQTLHAPMPAANLRKLGQTEWQAIVDLVHGRKIKLPFEATSLTWMTAAPEKAIRAELIGGNLSLWACLVGTDWQPKCRRKIVFLEDIDERPYRIDRMMVQIVQSGVLDGAAAIVLGDFTDCGDENVTVLEESTSEEARAALRADWSTGQRKPLRPLFTVEQALDEIFIPVGKKLGIPIAKGLPVGHGPNFNPLPLGAKYELNPSGQLKLKKWDWQGPSAAPVA